MKRILLVLALMSSMTFANAQQNVKSAAAAKAAVEAAQAAADNAKKATKVATWLKLANAYVDSYNAAGGNGWIGASSQELSLVMGNNKPLSQENVEINGQQYTKQVFATAEYYFNQNGQLAVINVTKPIIEGALEKALDAYKKAAEVDPKGTKTDDIKTGIKNVADKYSTDAVNAYTFGDMTKASQCFEMAAKAAATAPLSNIDNESVYNAGFTAIAAGDAQRALKMFEQCKASKYYGEEGDLFAKLAECYDKLGDKTAAKNALEEGFAEFPSSQAILVGLINYYVASGEDTDRLFVLLDNAKKNEPNNASLYYVEGNILKDFGRIDEAVAAYRKCADINASYEFGYIGEGMLRYNQAAEIQEKAQTELDDAKYMKLVDEFEVALKGCIEPFEKAYEVTKDDQIKTSIAEYLKNAFYRFREESDEYKAAYEKYQKIAAGE